MVLTQPWYLIFISLQESCFHTTMVLTQHFIAGLNYTIPLRFPYHYGSYATMPQNLPIPSYPSFPYHYGSYATYSSETQAPIQQTSFHTTMVLTQLISVFLVSLDLISGFHTTMVLTQQTSKHPFSEICSLVSIPLWFLRNRFYYKDIIQVLGRQNQPTGKIP